MARVAAARTVEMLGRRLCHRAGAGAVGAVRSKRMRSPRCSACPALLALSAFVLLPRFYAGGAVCRHAHAALWRSRWRCWRSASRPATLGSRIGWRRPARAFSFCGRVTSTVAFALFAGEQQIELAALPSMPRRRRGADAGRRAVDAAMGKPAADAYCRTRDRTRGGAFTNEQWALPGQQLIRPLHAGRGAVRPRPVAARLSAGERYSDDRFRRRDRAGSTAARSTMSGRSAFPPAVPGPPDLTLIWSSGRSALYRGRPLRSAAAQPLGEVRHGRHRRSAGGRRAGSSWRWRCSSMVPLLWPDIPPLVDLPGHMGRYRVQLDLHTYPLADRLVRFSLAADRQSRDRPARPDSRADLRARTGGQADRAVDPAADRRRAAVDRARGAWADSGDRAVRAAARLLLPAAVRVRQFHAVDGAGAAAVRVVAAARAARASSGCARSIFVPLSCALWVCHTFGWGVLGVLAFSAEMVREHDRAKQTRRAPLQPGHRGGHQALGDRVGARRAALPAARAADAADDRLAQRRSMSPARPPISSTGAPSSRG